MPEWTPSLLLALATFGVVGGMACLAMGMAVHWQQVAPPGRLHRPLRWRVAGCALLLVSLLLCLRADHASMAVLVWLMLLALGAVITAQVLAWRPMLLAWLVRAQ